MNRYGWMLCLAVAVGVGSLAGAAENASVRHIQRTMRQLNGDTGAGEPVKILFYGQSITAQPWTLAVARILRTRFPDTRWNMRFVNRAVGGYQADKLSRIANTLLYPAYPDLVIFHDYGKLEYVDEMIRRLREETTADIVIWTPHVRVSGEGAKKWTEEHPVLGWDDDRRSEGFRRIAKKYDCMLIDVRKMWKAHLARTGEDPKTYLKDVIHLNEKGNTLLAEMIGRELVRTTTFGEGRFPRNVSRVPVRTLEEEDDGVLTLPFTGNRVVAVADGANTDRPFSVRLDGKELSSFPEMFTYTPMKPNLRTLLRVGIGPDPVPDEEWTITFLKNTTSAASKWSLPFRLTGSVTGDDGEGDINSDFVSNSGRIRMESVDWLRGLGQSFLFRNKKLPDNLTKLTFKILPMYHDRFVPGDQGHETVLVQGIANGQHTLTITPSRGGVSGIDTLRVYCPQGEARPFSAGRPGKPKTIRGFRILDYDAENVTPGEDWNVHGAGFLESKRKGATLDLRFKGTAVLLRGKMAPYMGRPEFSSTASCWGPPA
ncbi:MAG: SGNH/GDSL hydrolase family protein [Victivallales bacterium]|nr:SGNH/GDSL hydrolase family protein [Victivallales bacterium]